MEEGERESHKEQAVKRERLQHKEENRESSRLQSDAVGAAFDNITDDNSNTNMATGTPNRYLTTCGMK